MENKELTDLGAITSFYENAKQVYSYFKDETSQGIFKNFLTYRITGDYVDLKNLLYYASPLIKKHLEQASNTNMKIDEARPIVIYGAGVSGKIIFDILNRKSNILFCDKNYDKMKIVKGVKVISPDELINNYSNEIIYTGSVSADEIYDFLVKNNIPKENIITSFTLLDADAQYFDSVMKPKESEIFLDIGSFDGYNSIRFSKWCNQKYKKIYVFEPDNDSMKRCKESISKNNLNDVEYFPYAAWNKKEVLKFYAVAGGNSTITETGEIEVNADSLDNLLGNSEAVTFIKMDIEGAELNALYGAKELITKYKPKLAISVYHKPEDIITIPSYIKQLVPEYSFYLRHYTSLAADTVLYAVIEN